MSGRQKLAQEELEVHRVLSGSASSTDSVPPGQRHPVANQNNDHSYSNVNSNNKDNLDKFKSMFKEMKTFIKKLMIQGLLKIK